MTSTSTPTDRGVSARPADFPTLVDALDYAAGARTGMAFHGPRGDVVEVLAYARLGEEARHVGERLLGCGLAPGDRVGLVAETEADFVRAFMGCVLARLIPCPMPLPAAFGDRDAYADQLHRIATVADMAAVILARPYGELVGEALADHRLGYVGALGDLDAPRSSLARAAPAPESVAYLQFSSGTTTRPRGIAVTHRALMANLHGMAAHALAIGDGDRGTSWLPFYHDMGLVGCMLLPLATQMSIDYLATRDFIRRPALWPQLIDRGRATISYAPSFGYQLAAQRARGVEALDLACWRVAGVGGDMVKTANLDAFARAYAPAGFDPASLVASYGMAEAALGLTFAERGRGCRTDTVDAAALERGEAVAARDREAARTFARCGVPLPGHEVAVRDGEGRALGPRRVGRIAARGPSVMQGYFRDPEATAAVLSTDGWLDTGDLGYVVDGELVITGRSKDLIIVNGRNIWPQDIEWMLEQRLAGVREGGVAAFGREPERRDGEEGLVVVLERRGAAEADAELETEAAAMVRDLVGVAAEVVVTRPGALPRTSSGKLSRTGARALYRDGRFDA